MSATQLILLERVENLGKMGDVVSVKPGYARNYLLPQKKAMRANKENVAYFEAQRKKLEAENDKRKGEAQKLAAKLEGLKAPLVRQASEGGQLYGSVNARDIAAVVAEVSKQDIQRNMVDLNDVIKTIGLFSVNVILHPEVKVAVTINVARSLDEAKRQEELGRALISGQDAEVEKEAAVEIDAESIFEEGAEPTTEEETAE